MHRHGGLAALDDYGTGHSGDQVLLCADFDIVKLDISLISHVDRDP